MVDESNQLKSKESGAGGPGPRAIIHRRFKSDLVRPHALGRKFADSPRCARAGSALVSGGLTNEVRSLHNSRRLFKVVVSNSRGLGHSGLPRVRVKVCRDAIVEDVILYTVSVGCVI